MTIDFSPLTKPFYGEALAEKGSDKITVVSESMLAKIMCAPKGATEEEILIAAGPCGTSGGWQLDKEREDYCVQCQDDSDREHWLLVC